MVVDASEQVVAVVPSEECGDNPHIVSTITSHGEGAIKFAALVGLLVVEDDDSSRFSGLGVADLVDEIAVAAPHNHDAASHRHLFCDGGAGVHRLGCNDRRWRQTQLATVGPKGGRRAQYIDTLTRD